ncbi:energy-coupling factor transporter transmembrane component T [Amphibacillus marinus]|uniref:energy-coupling factor transporter transmembrane component T n=1 Tax=Amphibacillus marinus TaxID=872970 RepID=UPI0015A5AC19
MRLKKNIVTTLGVMLRFFPVLISENKTFQEAAMLRGISYKHIRNWQHPLRIFEYSIVPLLMRTISLGEDLSMNGFMRGMDIEKRRTTLYSNSLTQFDLLILPILFTLLFIFLAG